jgi:hypothetical protein
MEDIFKIWLNGLAGNDLRLIGEFDHQFIIAQGQSGSAPNPAVREAAGEGAITAPSPPPSRRGKVAISAYFDPVVRQQLALLSVRQSRSQAALVAEALNLLFERHGESPVAKA